MMKKNSVKKVESRLARDEVKLKHVAEEMSHSGEAFVKTNKELVQLISILKETGFKDFMLYLRSPWRIFWSNFLGGMFRGLGIIIGMTLVFAILIWALGKFVNFPLIGEYFLDLKNLLEGFAPDNNYR